MRRIEALTGPAAIDYYRQRSADFERAGALLGSARDPLAAAERAAERLAELESKLAEHGRKAAGEEAEELVAKAEDVSGVRVVAARSALADQRELMDLASRVRAKLGDGAVVLGGAAGGKVALVVMLGEESVRRGLSAATIVRDAAQLVGGGGGGRDDAAQAGGRDESKLDDALESARAAITAGLGG